jgi:hypothetical protein
MILVFNILFWLSFILDVDYGLCITWIIHQQLWGYKVAVGGKNLVKLSLCHEGILGSRYIGPHFIGLGTSWRWVVSFMPLLLYPWRENPRYPLDTPRAGLDDIEKLEFLTLPRLELQPLSCPICSQSLYRLHYHGSYICGVRKLKRLNASRLCQLIQLWSLWSWSWS